jgi:hypothetical protein
MEAVGATSPLLPAAKIRMGPPLGAATKLLFWWAIDGTTLPLARSAMAVDAVKITLKHTNPTLTAFNT